ncbi:MAG TPA: serine hydrolase domain-containing protein [Spirochaetota bacterium]|nr:serine hydrolase domain-containing protein [Spirochaetota bacterium]
MKLIFRTSRIIPRALSPRLKKKSPGSCAASLTLFLLIVVCMEMYSCNGFSAVQVHRDGVNRTEAFDRKIAGIMQDYKIIGLSFVAVKNNSITGSGFYGLADKERNVPTGPDTIYRIASISKPFTATAIMQLVEQGRCSLDDDISHLLGYRVRNPYYPSRPITIRHLLTHTSGICDGGYYEAFLFSSYGDKPPSFREILLEGGVFYSRSIWRRTRPGKKFYYSNLGFGIIAAIVERVSGQRFDEYCRTNIFTPLGMNAGFNIAHLPSVDSVAVLYSHQSEKERRLPENAGKGEFEPAIDDYRGVKPSPRETVKFPQGYNGLMCSPQGGVRTSALDLAKFMMAHMNSGWYRNTKILSSNSVWKMQAIQWSGRRPNGLYRTSGLSFHVTRNLVEGKRLAGHSGRAYGFQGTMYFDPRSNSGIVLLMNGGDYYRDERGITEFHDIEVSLYRLIYSRYINGARFAHRAR